MNPPKYSFRVCFGRNPVLISVLPPSHSLQQLNIWALSQRCKVQALLSSGSGCAPPLPPSSAPKTLCFNMENLGGGAGRLCPTLFRHYAKHPRVKPWASQTSSQGLPNAILRIKFSGTFINSDNTAIVTEIYNLLVSSICVLQGQWWNEIEIKCISF